MQTNVTSALENPGFLDLQLAQLCTRMCEQSGQVLNKTQAKDLKTLACAASAATRDGTIALPLSALPDTLDLDALLELPVVGRGGDYAPLIIDGEHVWLYRYWQYRLQLDENIAQRLGNIALSAAQTQAISRTLADWYPDSSTPDWQRQAVAMAVRQQFSIISGGPGTGKTTSVLRLLWLLIDQLGVNPQRILLAAPTGKAAMRLVESIRHGKQQLAMPAAIAAQIPEQASTLHRLLGYQYGRVGFRYHRQNLLPAEVVIVDEASMIDISLMAHLFEAVPPQARLILLGDRDQLASVETGSVFRELCSDKPELAANITLLQTSWRFAADSGIGQLATAIKTGDQQQLNTILQGSWPDIAFTQSSSIGIQQLTSSWEDYQQRLQDYCRQPDPARINELFTAFNQFRILTPLRQGPSGTEQLNQTISRCLRRQQAYSAGEWFAGRPVMVTRNDYRQQLFNGDIGLTLPDAQGQLKVWFPEQHGFTGLAPVRLPEHETAWAMTIHKSQGSEFAEVLLVLPDDAELAILSRELLYTGVTRAKSKLSIAGKLPVLHAAVSR